jgi:hypothetical protein
MSIWTKTPLHIKELIYFYIWKLNLNKVNEEYLDSVPTIERHRLFNFRDRRVLFLYNHIFKHTKKDHVWNIKMCDYNLPLNY